MPNIEHDPGCSLIDTFVYTLINEYNYQGIANELGKLLGKPILIEDSFFRVLGKFLVSVSVVGSPKPQLTDPYIKSVITKIKKEKIPVVVPPLPQYGIRQSRIVYPVAIGNTLRGHLHIFDKKNPPIISGEEEKIVSKVLLALAIKIIKDESETKLKDEIISKLVRNLVFKEFYNEKVIQEAASILNMDLTIPSWILVVKFDGGASNDEGLKSLVSLFADKEIEARFVHLQNSLFLIIINESIHVSKRGNVVALARELILNFEKCFPGVLCYVAFGRKCLKPDDYHLSYSEAIKALDFLKATGSKSQVLSFDGLGSIGLVTLSTDVEQLLSFAHNILKPLIVFDERNPRMKLVQTLNSYLINNNQIKQTAQDLFVHVNTLRYRLDKIREISSLDLENAEIKFNAFLALKVLTISDTLSYSSKGG